MKYEKESDKYFVLNTKGTIFSGNYQLLEKTENHPSGMTIGIYKNKKDAAKAFNEVAHKTKINW